VRVYELRNETGDLFAFEVDVSWGGRRRVCAVVRRIPEAKLRQAPRFLSWFREETFCRFELDGTEFEICEPFGDNSRYWVGPADATRGHSQIVAILDVFRSA